MSEVIEVEFCPNDKTPMNREIYSSEGLGLSNVPAWRCPKCRTVWMKGPILRNAMGIKEESDK